MNDPSTEDLKLTINGRLLAPAWLGVSLAAGTDKDDPLFYRATSVEFFPHGLRLAACDRYLMLTAWVPALGDEREPPPDLDESPKRAMTMRDLSGRLRSLMGATYAVPVDGEATEDENVIEVEVSIATADRPAWRGMHMLAMDGLDREAVAFEVPNRERLRVGVLEGEWPDWRMFLGNHVNRSTKALAVNTDRLAKLAQLGKYLPEGSPLGLYFGGQNKPVRVGIGEPPLEITGAIMTVRWDYGLEPEDAPA